ncbi:MAG: hypothetical protein JRD05_12395 [Deltaproteobacteria bacterium]|nr:hypothetical protein [Deltaproteobacteria bacterium]
MSRSGVTFYLQQKEYIAMDLLEFALIFTVIYALYNLQQIKITLKEKGLTVDVIKGSLGDYRKFKDLIRNEPDQQSKMKYQRILNGLHFSLFGLVLFAIMILRVRL